MKHFNEKHGMTATPTYNSWIAMRKRCNSRQNKDFKRYGGRGITICARWRDFSYFLEDMGLRPPLHTLGRKDNDIGYTPDNCRWESITAQNKNRSCSINYEYRGERRTLLEWSVVSGLQYETLYRRWKKGERGKGLFRPSLRKRKSLNII